MMASPLTVSPDWMMLFIVLGVGVCALAIIAIIAFALIKGRPGVAALIGGAALLLGLPCIGIVVAIMATNHHPFGGTVESAVETVNGLQYFPSDQQFTPTVGGGPVTWSVTLRPMLFIVCGGMALLILAARRGLSHSTGGGRHRIWPAFAVLPILALLFVGNVRYQSEYRQTGAHRAAKMSEAIRQQPRTFVKQQQAMAKQVAAISADVRNQIERSDIHQLMDQFDAPRIVLQSPLAPTAGPAALMIAAATTSNATPSEPSSAVEVEVPSPPAAPTPPEQPTVSIPTTPATPPETPTATPPAWVDDPPKRIGDVRREVIATEEYQTASECQQAADVYLMFKAYERLQQLIGKPYLSNSLPSISFANGAIVADGVPIAIGRSPAAWRDHRLIPLNDMGITPDYLRREIVAKDPSNNESHEYLKTVNRSFGPMQKLYLQIEFTPEIDRELLRNWDAYNRQQRFGMVGVGAASVLGLLSMVWGLLKIDTASKGYYTKRLFIGVPAAIIGVALLLWADPLNMF